ncbi:MAG: Lar family restriction alleviation protein [Lentisphaeria bacterium]|nr:Lar family restriction alleviation protein [Lentisphaeria bacterium]
MKEELKPCPFCGKSESVFFVETFVEGRYADAPAIGCSTCGFRKYGIVANLGDEEKTKQFSDNLLINWWNRRNENEQ